MLQGKTQGDTFVVLDAFALPVEGTETRVNAANDANEYMVDYVTAGQEARAACAACLSLSRLRGGLRGGGLGERA